MNKYMENLEEETDRLLEKFKLKLWPKSAKKTKAQDQMPLQENSI